MAWLAIWNAHQKKLSSTLAQHAPGALLARGSLVIETYLSPDDRPQTLFSSKELYPWERSLSIRAVPRGGIVLVQSQNNQTRHTTLKLDPSDRTELLRVTFSWDAPQQWVRLSVERPEKNSVREVVGHAPWPIQLQDIRSSVATPDHVEVDHLVEYFAFSDQIEPLGPSPTLSPMTPLLTSNGYQHVKNIEVGASVESVERGAVSVKAHIKRTVPAYGSFRPVRLRAPYFGLQQDIIVAPDQKLVIRQPLVEYMFGKEAVLVPARHLVNGSSAVWERHTGTVTYHQLILPQHETMLAAGAPAESLNIGRLRRKPSLLSQSLLAGEELAHLPEHLISSHQVLRSFEAVTLVEQIAA